MVSILKLIISSRIKLWLKLFENKSTAIYSLIPIPAGEPINTKDMDAENMYPKTRVKFACW